MARVSLARFPRSGLGWVLRQDATSPEAPGQANSPGGGIPSPWRTADERELPVTSANLATTTTSQAKPSGFQTPPVLQVLGRADPVPLKPVHPKSGSDVPASGYDTAAGDGAGTGTGIGIVGGPTVTLLRVPLRLCLSLEVPGCCPPAARSPALRALSSSSTSCGSSLGGGCTDREGPLPSWEVQLAAVLIWTCRRGEGGGGKAAASVAAAAVSPTEAPARTATATGTTRRPLMGGGAGCVAATAAAAPLSRGGGCSGGGQEAEFDSFWGRYRSLLPGVEELRTLLFFRGEEELAELQDPTLAAEALTWQRAVRDAYDRWIDTPAFRAEVGDVPFSEWLWAVGCVESRAFGFRSPTDGRELHAYVPFFCVANYQPGAPTLHVLRLNPDWEPNPDPDPVLRPDPRPSQSAPGPWGRQSETGGGSAGCGDDESTSGKGGGGLRDGSSSRGSSGGELDAAARRVEGTRSRWDPTADMLLLLLPDDPASTQPPQQLHQRRQQERQAHSRHEGHPWGQTGQHHNHHHRLGEVGCPGDSGGGLRYSGEPWVPGTTQLAVRGKTQEQELHQVFIDYGKKDNRSLMFQYGFILHGNPYDRLNWGGAALDASCRMRRDWVYDMAEQLSREAEAAEDPGSAATDSDSPLTQARRLPRHEGGERSPLPPVQPCSRALAGLAIGPGPVAETGGAAAVADAASWDLKASLRFGGAAAVRRRFRSAATSIVQACGWRNLRERRQVTRGSEGRALQLLTRWTEDQLTGGFSTTARRDAELLLLLPHPRMVPGMQADERFSSSSACTESLQVLLPRKAHQAGSNDNIVDINGTGPFASAGGLGRIRAALLKPDRTRSADAGAVTSMETAASDGATEMAPGHRLGDTSGATAAMAEAAATEAIPAVAGQGGGAGDGSRSKGVPYTAALSPRVMAAVEYRLERKLLLAATLELLRRLRGTLESEGGM